MPLRCLLVDDNAAYLDAAEVMDVTSSRHRGLLSGDDLAAWRASTEPPVTLEFRGLTVCKTGPWGQGPVFLQQLALLSGVDLAAMDPGSAEYIHTVTEVAKLAFADREAWYGDPAFSDVPLGELLSAATFASPKSRILAWPRLVMKMLAGLMSRWTMPLE